MTDPDDPRRTEEAILVLRVQAGGERAFERLYGRYEARLLYYLRRVAGDPDLAEDAFQETWLKAYRSIGRLRDPRAFRTWLYRIARNAALDRLRGAAREVPLDDPGARAEVAGRTLDEPDFDGLDAAEVHAGLQRVDAIHREVLTLAFLEDLSYAEIAEVVGAPIGTIRSRIHYARRALARAIEALREGENPVTGGDR